MADLHSVHSNDFIGGVSTNHYRSDDVSAINYFYLIQTKNNFPLFSLLKILAKNTISLLTFGLPTGTIYPFKEAIDVAAISQLYRGIHYMPTINNGEDRDRKVGNLIEKSLITRNTK